MAENVDRLRIFVASPKDCSAERDAVRQLVRSNPTIQTVARELNVALDIYGWEDVCPDVGRPQEVINAAIEKYDPNWFVFIFWHRLGSDAGEGMTGTEEEWKIALELKQQEAKEVFVSIYFNQASAQLSDTDSSQLEAVKVFRENIFKNFKALALDYNGPKDFADKFSAHLSEKLMGLSHNLARGISERLFDASVGLLLWPTTLGNGKHIERAQLKTLLQKIEELDSSATIILGPPGSGKSAFLATLANVLRNRGITLLAIKADQLGVNVESFEDLRHFLELPISPRDALIAQLTKAKVILIIDQLDAVSELLDRKSQRLNILLNLIHSLAGRHNVHIVASSREFEFRHDVRLSSIDAERLDLEPLNWEQVSEVLSQAGIRPETIGEPLKNLLLAPLNLKVFLDLGPTNATFETHHALLEELWKQRVVSAESGADRELLLQLLADRMSSDETLWVPSALADSYPAARQALEQAEILTRGENGLTVGFRHQTFYDFTIARAFARGARSLSKDVLDRQNGLFVRPSLVSGLNYLRAAARSEYHKQLSLLMGSELRLHLQTLIIEFLGDQSDPHDCEVELLLPLLTSENEGPRVLRSVAKSTGWFTRLRQHPGFRKWLGASPDKAANCVPLLSSVISQHPKQCVDLIEKFWIGDEAYDALGLAVFQERKDWDHHGVELVCTIVRRTEQLSWSIESLAEKVAETAAGEAPLIIRADFDRRLEKALKELEEPVPILPPDADRQQRLMHELTYERSRPIRRVIEDSQIWDNLDEFATRAPKAFLEQLWPWLVNVVNQMAKDEHDFVVSYRRDPTSYRKFEGDLEPAPIVRALLTGIIELATKDKNSFLQFLNENISSDLLIVHRLLTRGLESIASQEPNTALEYLSSDPRRLVVGDMHDQREDTKRLIKAISPYLDSQGIQDLTKLIRSHSRYKRSLSERSPKERLDRLRWNREERLDLLRVIPLDLLSEETRKFRLEEERVFPAMIEPDTQRSGPIFGVIGSRMSAVEMARASDDDLLRLFTELPDETRWDNPKRTWSQGQSRAGGAIQCSREFGELAKQSPQRVLSLIQRLQPGVHEQYAGEALKGLVNTDLPVSKIISLFEELDDRGFRSMDFHEDVASAAEVVAGRNKGLPDSFLQRLKVWLTEELEPVWPQNPTDETNDDSQERTSSILYEHSISSSLTHARGSITRAIAEGYLKREPPGIEEWGRFIESRLSDEKHPKLWSEILTRMPVLFQGNHRQATELFDKVIKTCPGVLNYPFALNAIAHVVRGLDPKETGDEWLDKLLTNGSAFCRQAYGELLPLFNCRHLDASSTDRIAIQLAGDRSPDIDLGLAYAATYLWTSKRCRGMATQILCTLASSDDETVQRAVASIFRLARDYFEMDESMRQILESLCSNPSVLLLSAQDIIPVLEGLTGTEPQLVSKVCGVIVKFGRREQVGKPGTSWVFVADTLTNIALTLHRQNAYREEGLQLFEQLIALNVREAKDAIELLDRRPIVGTLYQHRRRWKRKLRRVRQSS